MLLQLLTGDSHVSLAALLPQILVWAWASLLGKWAVAHQEVLTHLLHFSKVSKCSSPRQSATVLKHKKLHNMSSYGTEMLPERPVSPTAAKVKAEVHVQWSLLETRAQEPGFSPSVEEQMGGKASSSHSGRRWAGGSKHLGFLSFSEVLFYSDVILRDRSSVSFRFSHGPDGCCHVCVKRRMLFEECFTFKLGFVIILISFNIWVTVPSFSESWNLNWIL